MEQEKSHYSFARDGFIYLLSYVTLMIFSVATNHLIKAVINPLLPKETEGNYYGWISGGGGETIVILLASIIIAFPIYVGLNIWANKMLGNGSMRHNTGVRNWLIYLTMAIVVIVVISQLVYLLITFLGGGLPVVVGVHALISIIISIAVLGYQWWQLKFFDGSPKKLTLGFRIFEWAAIAVVLAALVWGFASIENPAAKRARGNDASRQRLLSSITYQIQSFYGHPGQEYDTGRGRLPKSFEDLATFDSNGYIPETNDPITKQPFEYRVTGSKTYELCATFETDVSAETIKALKDRYGDYYDYGGSNKEWYHPKGRHCFTRTIGSNNYY